MRSRNLETLLWVVRLGGVSAAARHLNMTQPAVTRRIQELERDLGTKLFRQSGRILAPTPAARVAVLHAERVITELAAMRTAAGGGAAVRSILRLGVAELIALTWLDRLLARTSEAYPNVTFELDVDLSSRLVDRLAQRKLDAAFLPGPVPIAGIVRIDIGASAVKWVAAPALVGARASLSPQEMRDMPIILPPQGADTQGMVARWFAAANVQPQRVSTCNSLSVKASLVRKGIGISALPTDLVAGELASGALVALPERPAFQPVVYSAAYIPLRDLEILPHLVQFAKEESWFAPAEQGR